MVSIKGKHRGFRRPSYRNSQEFSSFTSYWGYLAALALSVFITLKLAAVNNFEIADHDAATLQHLTHNSTVVRVLGLIAFLLATAAVIVSGVHNARNPFEEFPAFDTPGQKLIATYSYFTLWSNIVGAGLGLAYFLGNHESRWAAAARIDAAMMLLVTGLVYNFVLADGSPSIGTYRFTNPVEHMIMPVLMPVIWILSMPRRKRADITPINIGLALILPIIWCVWTFARGAATGWYPYFFLDVNDLGYTAALKNTAGVFLLFFVLIALLAGVEQLLRRLGMRR